MQFFSFQVPRMMRQGIFWEADRPHEVILRDGRLLIRHQSLEYLVRWIVKLHAGIEKESAGRTALSNDTTVFEYLGNQRCVVFDKRRFAVNSPGTRIYDWTVR